MSDNTSALAAFTHPIDDLAMRRRTPMRLALRFARAPLGQTWPNPAVGAVVTNEATGVILGVGGTAPGGRPHAEVMALRMAATAARGATMFVTMEPCCHYGKSPPCVEAIAAAGIKRLIYAVEDPNPLVAGKGLDALRAQGVEVRRAADTDEAHWISLGHILRMRENRPFVQLKLAVGSDGLVPRGGGKPVFVTDKIAQTRTHLMRARADAILVGNGTVKTDDPSLTCRLPGLGWRSPVRVVLARRADLSHDSKLARTAASHPVWVLHGVDAPPDNIARLRSIGVECLSCALTPDGRLAPGSILQVLSERGITRLMIEGGPAVARAFLDAGYVDEMALFRGARPAGANGLAPFPPDGLDLIPSLPQLVIHESRELGPDRLALYRNTQRMDHVHRDHH
ncbi:bifunctional diaminohydroxyphosphoribosylaminopyrimidine deaminase/5-amino-6-(5-phosphoribosylamino)uracil reductase RibD [Dichotomicrobium thermohalophilum]|uniref:Riboflavin biosynthesis protein RibD n=1 Tax=Dichotomicrobium thermohalophilum TaxID=933063 RepID=A0A397QC86_9HYPH|nr:bifunctional diaminohydroxyphosphoribosylaminopyrimidine deaminase/5-amino-6-(5-phosphoribosylamino)uracil reductase RibD [Dichotomicrobium thermohalophilum]RIA55861.1 diaminohydroxyphosphoribosylaminopyrimidine deaminase/5-amino-6-(5-phosphoribosylamino)uracil reductase [Dichotomicrobium thermohalophilum]